MEPRIQYAKTADGDAVKPSPAEEVRWGEQSLR
jgi:hypothetical protein